MGEVKTAHKNTKAIKRAEKIEEWKATDILPKKMAKYEEYVEGIKKIENYIKAQGEAERYLTTSGMIRASGFGTQIYRKACAGERDYLLAAYFEDHHLSVKDIKKDAKKEPYVLVGGHRIPVFRISDKLQDYELMVAEQTEERLYDKGRTGDIFALKAAHGWRDGSESDAVPRVHNQTLVIADREQAERAIKMLK